VLLTPCGEGLAGVTVAISVEASQPFPLSLVSAQLLGLKNLGGGLAKRIAESRKTLHESLILHLTESEHERVSAELLREDIEGLLQLKRLLDTALTERFDELSKLSNRGTRHRIIAETAETRFERGALEAILEVCMESSDGSADGAEAVFAGVDPTRHHDGIAELLIELRLAPRAKRLDELGLSDTELLGELRSDDGMWPLALLVAVDEGEKRHQSTEEVLLLTSHVVTFFCYEADAKGQCKGRDLFPVRKPNMEFRSQNRRRRSSGTHKM